MAGMSVAVWQPSAVRPNAGLHPANTGREVLSARENPQAEMEPPVQARHTRLLKSWCLKYLKTQANLPTVSRLVRLLLIQLGLYEQTTHEDRVEIDREIEQRTGVNCDEAIENGLISIEEFVAIVQEVLRRKSLRKKKPLEIPAMYA